MAKAEKLPSGTWRVRVQYYDELGNRHHRSIIGKTEAEALYNAEREGKKLQHAKPEDEDLTLFAASQRFIESRERILSPSTIRGYKQISKSYFSKLFEMKIGKVDNRAIQRAVNDDQSHSPKSLMNAVGFVSVVLKEYRPDFELKVKLPKRKRDIRPIPSLDEVGIILNACEGRAVELPVKLAIYLGMRLSEIAGVKYSDIKDGKIYINTVIVHSDHGFVEKNMTKNASSTRIVSLPPHLAERIAAERKVSTSDRICPSSPTTIYKAYQRMLKSAGLPRYRFHDLRHCNASIMLRLNIPTKYQMQRGGWSTTSTLQTTYQHTMSDYETEVDSQIYSFIDSLKDKNQ